MQGIIAVNPHIAVLKPLTNLDIFSEQKMIFPSSPLWLDFRDPAAVMEPVELLRSRHELEPTIVFPCEDLNLNCQTLSIHTSVENLTVDFTKMTT